MTADWLVALESLGSAVGPVPDGASMRIEVSCRTSRERGAKSRRHALLVRSDWSAEVPHDLPSERLAVAMGGYLSCIDLIDDAVPALRVWLRGMLRADIPRLKFFGGGERWRAEQPEACCDRTGYASAAAAADHVRSPAHVARALGTEPRQLNSLAVACQRAHGGSGAFGMTAQHVAAAALRCVHGAADVAALWDAGVHPLVLTAIHDAMAVEGPLPARFYLGVVSRRPDLRWVADTITAAAEATRQRDVTAAPTGMPDESTERLETWLAWSQQDWDLVDPRARGRWIGTGVTRPLVLVLGEAGYDPDAVVAYARSVRRHPDNVARTIRRWLEAGFDPDLGQLISLSADGVSSHHVPSRAAVARFRAEAGALAQGRSDTELALLFARAGTVASAISALRRDEDKSP